MRAGDGREGGGGLIMDRVWRTVSVVSSRARRLGGIRRAVRGIVSRQNRDAREGRSRVRRTVRRRNDSRAKARH